MIDSWMCAYISTFWQRLERRLMDLRLHYLRQTLHLLKAQFISRRPCELAKFYLYCFFFSPSSSFITITDGALCRQKEKHGGFTGEY